MEEKLKLGWSPEQISYRIREEYPTRTDMRISYESIYKYIYYEAKGTERQRLISYLPYKKKRRYGGSKRTVYLGVIIDRVSIDERPETIENRNEIGHWEGDLIVGKGQKSAIGTLVERATRFTLIVHLESRKSKDVVNAFSTALQTLPDILLKTLTYDNGIEMSEHKHFTYRTKMPVYFAHPYSSWERGTNENTNGLIRRFFPKKTDFNKVSADQLKEVERLLNSRPRKVISWRTPEEELKRLIA